MTKYTRNSLTTRINSYPGPEVLGRINKKVLLEILEGRREKAEREYEQRNKQERSKVDYFILFSFGLLIGSMLTMALA